MRAAIRLASAVVLLATLGSGSARAVPTTLTFSCDGRPGTIGAMENEYIAATTKGACWFHLGHHTYDMGTVYAVGQITGSLFSVEVDLSPPTEVTDAGGALAMEGSVDGLTWTTIGQMRFNLLEDRQAIDFSFDAKGLRARYLRIRQPQSAAQGLSGYLDGSGFTADAEPVEPPAATAVAGTQTFACAEHIMERFVATHPCWFGGINRYDSPSVFHTYPIGASTLTRVRGTASFFPWRTDDTRRTAAAVPTSPHSRRYRPTATTGTRSERSRGSTSHRWPSTSRLRTCRRAMCVWSPSITRE